MLSNSSIEWSLVEIWSRYQRYTLHYDVIIIIWKGRIKRSGTPSSRPWFCSPRCLKHISVIGIHQRVIYRNGLAINTEYLTLNVQGFNYVSVCNICFAFPHEARIITLLVETWHQDLKLVVLLTYIQYLQRVIRVLYLIWLMSAKTNLYASNGI